MIWKEEATHLLVIGFGDLVVKSIVKTWSWAWSLR
jgi:hypothetical protein